MYTSTFAVAVSLLKELLSDGINELSLPCNWSFKIDSLSWFTIYLADEIASSVLLVSARVTFSSAIRLILSIITLELGFIPFSVSDDI